MAPLHEQPLLQYGSKVVLQPGMVFTIDPACTTLTQSAICPLPSRIPSSLPKMVMKF
ncbi:MAG: hypothetical protein KJ077_41790 [Anaerolineae bacterium]|nr:hypothetical protein [Anaerolineae bacterium]